jgi:hypothetical protein
MKTLNNLLNPAWHKKGVNNENKQIALYMAMGIVDLYFQFYGLRGPQPLQR